METPEDVVRHWYEARERGDIDEAAELLAPQVVWHVPGRSPVGANTRAARLWRKPCRRFANAPEGRSTRS